MDTKELRALMEAYQQVYAPQEIEEGYQEPRLDRKAFVKHANKRSGFSLGTREDPHGWREPGMEKVAKEYAARTSSARRAKRTGQPDTYRKEKESQSKLRKEHFDIFDTVLEFLQAEGYAETLEEAEWMMANVIDDEAIEIILGEGHGSRTSFKKQSEDERKRVSMFKGSKIEYTPHKNYDPEANRGQGQILRPNQAEKQRRKKLAKSAMGEEYMDEAQEARNNPEKYEAGEKKKYAPVRGERTPMPPRGDKRREDFEKWYAANVR